MVKAAAVGTLGVAVALLWAPAAMAVPDVPVDPSVPPAVVEPAPAAAEAAPAVDPLAMPPAEAVPPPVPGADAVLLTVTPPDGVPHLATPDALPPGTTQQQTRNSSTRGYLKDVWEAVRSGDVTTGEALLLIAQRPMDSKGALQDMTPQQSTTPGAAPVPGAEPLPSAPEALPPAEAVPPVAAVPAAEAAPPAEVPLPDPAPPLPFDLAP